MLHAERALRGGGKVIFEAPFADFPSGTFIELNAEAFLVWHGRLLHWSFGGYSEGRLPPAQSALVRVLTPASVVRVFSSGFVPDIHVSGNKPTCQEKNC